MVLLFKIFNIKCSNDRGKRVTVVPLMLFSIAPLFFVKEDNFPGVCATFVIENLGNSCESGLMYHGPD